MRLRAENFLDNPRALGRELEAEGALQFNPGPRGLFAASDMTDAALAEITGMGMAWFRDNAVVAHALHERGTDDDKDKAGGVGRAFLEILLRNETLLMDFIRAPEPGSPRLPVRVSAATLENDTEPRIQNDSTGYALWLPAKLMLSGTLGASRDDLSIMAQGVRYLAAGQYWQERDEGAWEEDRQVRASSIGVVIAGLQVVARVFEQYGYRTNIDFSSLVGRGKEAFAAILPYGESLPTDTHPGRRYDASHLFLTEVVELFRGDLFMTAYLTNRIEEELVRGIGVIRYPGDSYYAPGFTAMLGPGERTSQAEGRLEERNSLGPEAERTQTEAQWTLFDPLLSANWGRGYENTHSALHRAEQLTHLNRSLGHYLSLDNGLRVPELFYKETPKYPWQPNDHVPLLMAQAAMLLALNQFEKM